MAEPEEAPDQKKSRPPVTRSPSYPIVSLKVALERAKTFYEKEGRNAASPEIAAGHWGFAKKSSGGKQTVATLRSFGLLEGEGSVKLTDLALRILLDTREESTDRDGLIRKAALLPKMHSKLWKAYGLNPPSPGNLRHKLIFDEKFNENTVDDFIREYQDTLVFAKISESDRVPLDGQGSAEADDPKGGLMQTELTGGGGEPLRGPPSRVPVPAIGKMSFQVPFRGATLSVQISVDGERLTKAHVERVRRYLEIAKDDLDTTTDQEAGEAEEKS